MSDEYTPVQDEEPVGGGLIAHIPEILIHRRWFIIFPLVICSIAGVAAAFLLPTTYRSASTLLVESQELPADLVGSPVTALIDQRIAKIRQQVLSRGRLIALIQQYDLYPAERSNKPLSAIIEEMRDNTDVAAVSGGIGQGASPDGRSNTIAFSMSFDYTEPTKAQLVMQSFVESFLQLDAEQMSEQADNTVNFLTEQSNGIQKEISGLESQITALKTQNGSILAGNGIPAIAPGGYDTQIAALQRENLMLDQQARPAGGKDPLVAQAETDLVAARAMYTDDHPDVKLAERRVDMAKQVSANQTRSGGSAVAAAAIAANNAEIARLVRTRGAEEARYSSAVSAQSRAPVLMEQVSQLESRADSLRGRYRDVAERLFKARTSAQMENEQKGERLSVIDPPIVPDKPLSPNRPLLISGGIGGGLALGIVLAFLVELLLHPIRGVGQIEKLLGVPPLAVIPTMNKGTETVTGFAKFWASTKRLLSFRHRSAAR